MSKECCNTDDKIAQSKSDDNKSVNDITIVDNGHIEEDAGWKTHWALLLALVILISLIVLKYGFAITLNPIAGLVTNLFAYLLAGHSVLRLAFRKSIRGDVFNEFVLMSVATIGAFLIKEYEEGVAVMVFYCIGEWFQDAAVDNAKRNIKALLDVRPDKVSVVRNGDVIETEPASIEVGETIQIKAGEKVALDGSLVSENASFNTAALTGESK